MAYESINEIIQYNRRTLAKVNSWITPELYQRSVARYGILPKMLTAIDEPLTNEPTYTDMLLFLAQGLRLPLRYLELGVSVGKNFLQLAYALRNSLLVGFDIEDLNPVIARNSSDKLILEQWQTAKGSNKKSNSFLLSGRIKRQSNSLLYLCADIRDRQSWQRLKYRQFNIIFSDAIHTPEAIRAEFDLLREFNLIDRNEFLMSWDDLDEPEMTETFLEIWHELKTDYGATSRLILKLNGWMGKNEAKHKVGFIMKLNSFKNQTGGKNGATATINRSGLWHEDKLRQRV